MNRRTVVVGALAVGAGTFAAGSWYVARRQEAEQAAAVRETLQAQPDALVRPHSPILGPADAPVSVVEFFDPSCEACRAFHPVINELRRQYPDQLRVVLRYTPFHEGSDEAVRILEVARRQNLFEPVLDVLFDQQPAWALHGQPNMDLAWNAAGEAGLDLSRAESERLHPEITGILNQDMADVQAMQITGTPTFFVNGERLTELSIQNLRTAVSDAVAGLG
ncbi:disulfide bond formation protein DsbA [Paracoccus sediminis]|uniref:Disulfide bond formation protein DsbA n=1 Tax=Paracoccus sediminis TaxID=1214787 RepID=A0A238UVF9_9RHOB|nr:thioredoxin domain-containing protein [Paracoccus sediminis]TBN52749.1 disulfide bond formation protein DsbA [Paracoccus sediminis]SNR26172.1 Protein-disulfide isomerase [Paracoccus sediminis]